MTATLQPPPVTSKPVHRLVAPLCSLALRGLRRMYRSDQLCFSFRLRKPMQAGTPAPQGQDVLEGVSWRYTAIALIGLATRTADEAREALHGDNPQDVCVGLIQQAQQSKDIGQVALALWAARAWQSPHVKEGLKTLVQMDPGKFSCTTVELSWCLTALTIGQGKPLEELLAHTIARRLLESFHPESSLFPHWPSDTMHQSFRSHVACFADLVYPIQALSHYFDATGRTSALRAAKACGRRMVQSQGPAGQWWWHHDVRTGHVVEGYPVYSVHQDGMAPMALRALQQVCGEDSSAAIARGLDWLEHSPEIDGGSLIDAQSDVIWRKVARTEPNKLSRGLQAYASRLHPSLRLPLDGLFPPGKIDYEFRPYHMGWILYANGGTLS